MKSGGPSGFGSGKKIAALEILSAPISNGVKVTNDFFIRIGELPQMMLNKINKSQG